VELDQEVLAAAAGQPLSIVGPALAGEASTLTASAVVTTVDDTITHDPQVASVAVVGPTVAPTGDLGNCTGLDVFGYAVGCTGGAPVTVFVLPGNRLILTRVATPTDIYRTATTTDTYLNAATWTVDGVAPPPTATALVSSQNPAAIGQPVTFTATVSGGASPTGSVQFKDGASNLGPPIPLTGPTAALTTAALSAGTHTITATYLGDAANGSSTSPDLSQVIDANLPAVTTLAATAIAATGATLNGTVSSNGSSTTVSFEYGLTATYGNTAVAVQSPLPAGAASAAVSTAIGGLACATTYHFRAVGANSSGPNHGADLTFATAACATAVTLNVTLAGSGGSNVSSNPLGISCQPDCSASYAAGTSVALIATPDAGSVFGGWSDACAGTGICTLVMSTVRNATAMSSTLAAGSANSNLWVQKAYVAYYGRPADPAGLGYWASRMDAEGGSLSSIIASFGFSDEFTRRYGTLTYSELLDTLYQQTLGRAPDPIGKAWYLDQLNVGLTTPQRITLDLLGGATGDDLFTVAHRLDVANHYTGKVAAGCPYVDELTGVASLAPVTADWTTAWAAKLVIEGRCGP
jgi:hypothetical protein